MRTIAAVVTALSAALVAEAALSLVEPVRTSAPVSSATTMSASGSSPRPPVQVRRMVPAPRSRAPERTPRANGVTELADTASTTSSRPMPLTAARPAASPRAEPRLSPARPQRPDARGRGAERGRALGSFEHAQTAAGAGAGDHERSARGERVGDAVGGAGDRRAARLGALDAPAILG